MRSAGDPEGLGQPSVDSKGTGTQPHLTDHCAHRAVRRRGAGDCVRGLRGRAAALGGLRGWATVAGVSRGGRPQRGSQGMGDRGGDLRPAVTTQHGLKPACWEDLPGGGPQHGERGVPAALTPSLRGSALESCQAAPTPSTHHAQQKHACSLAKTHVRICTPAPLRVTQTWKPAGQNEQPRKARSSGSIYRSSGKKAGWRGCGVGRLGPMSHGDQG